MEASGYAHQSLSQNEAGPTQVPVMALGAMGDVRLATVPRGSTCTKAQATQLLRRILGLLEARKYGDAAKHFLLPAGAKPAGLADLLKNGDLSKTGIDRLGSRGGFFGKADALFKPQRVAELAKKVNADVTTCWGMRLGDAEVIVQWHGGQLKVVHLDDVGKPRWAPVRR